MTKILLSTVAVLGFAGTAFAADLPVKAPRIVAAPAFTWTGCYLGANAGWIGNSDKATTGPVLTTGAYVPAAGNYLSQDSSKSGATVGGQAGCNYQIGMFVVGGEADAAYSSLKTGATFLNADPTFGAVRYESFNSDLNWFATARVRAGLTFDRALIYATGGLAVGAVNFNHLVVSTTAGSNAYLTGYDKNRIGWTVGGGIEYAITNNWTVKAEYLYINLGKEDSYSGLGNNIVGVTRWGTSYEARENVARIGFNYLFHPTAPVVAKY